MKLVRITHMRCGDVDCGTWAFAPDTWSEYEVNDAAVAAQNAYLVAFRAALSPGDDPEPRNPGWAPNYKAYPAMLVYDVDCEFAAAKAIHEAWRVRRSFQGNSFEQFLWDHGFIAPWGQEAENESFAIDIDWGHAHGSPFRYGDEATDRMPRPSQLARMRVVDVLSDALDSFDLPHDALVRAAHALMGTDEDA